MADQTRDLAAEARTVAEALGEGWDYQLVEHGGALAEARVRSPDGDAWSSYELPWPALHAACRDALAHRRDAADPRFREAKRQIVEHDRAVRQLCEHARLAETPVALRPAPALTADESVARVFADLPPGMAIAGAGTGQGARDGAVGCSHASDPVSAAGGLPDAFSEMPDEPTPGFDEGAALARHVREWPWPDYSRHEVADAGDEPCVLAWRSRVTGFGGRGATPMPRRRAERLAAEADRRFPELRHWPEPVAAPAPAPDDHPLDLADEPPRGGQVLDGAGRRAPPAKVQTTAGSGEPYPMPPPATMPPPVRIDDPNGQAAASVGRGARALPEGQEARREWTPERGKPEGER